MGPQAPLTAALRVEDDPALGPVIHHKCVVQVSAVEVVGVPRDAGAIQKVSQGLAGQGHLVWLRHGLMMSRLLAPPAVGARGLSGAGVIVRLRLAVHMTLRHLPLACPRA